MAKQTIKARLQAAILAKGGAVVKQSHKTLTMSYPGYDGFLFLGNSGSCRQGKNKTTSIPVSERLKREWLA